MTQLTRALLDSELNELNQSILAMGSMVDAAIVNAIDALLAVDIAQAQAVIAGDAEVNRLRFHIEERAYIILATQQPMARDLRTVITAMHMAIELERIGDHAAGIARIVTRLEGMPLPPLLLEAQEELQNEPADEPSEDMMESFVNDDMSTDDTSADGPVSEGDAPPKRLKLTRLPKMAKRARSMLNRAITAYLERDADKAMAIVKRDRKLNRQYRKFFAEAMAELSNQSVVEIPTYLLWIAHNLERIGDRTTNMAERTVFMVTAQYTEVLEEYE
jgi:phosphate transport system protein